MTVIDDLLATLPSEAVPVRHVLVGARWTVVCSRYAGMAATLNPPQQHGRQPAREFHRLRQKGARELAELARSSDLLEASIGVAAINSLLDVDETQAHETNASEVLSSRGAGKSVAMVGHFPFTDDLRGAVGRLWVIELHPAEGEYPAEAAIELLPMADVVGITGSALINHTMDGLLSWCNPSSTVMILGPSTPLSPVLFEHGASIISGTRIVDEAAVLQAAGQGASFRQVEGVKLLTFVRPESRSHRS